MKLPKTSSTNHASIRSCRLSLLVLSMLGAGLGQQGNAPGLRYKEASEWPTQAKSVAGTPAGPWNFGQVAAVATTTSGHILVFHRGAHPIMEFDSGGKFINSWGNGMISEGKVTRIALADRMAGGSSYTAVYGPAGCYSCGAHSVRVDPGGNIWVVDATAHVVYKMNQQQRVIMQLGTKGISGGGADNFNLPTDVAFAPNGDLYVSDGCPASAGNGEQRSAVKLTEGTHEKNTKALHSPREGRHFETASGGQGAGLEALRRTGAAADGVLPLAEGVL